MHFKLVLVFTEDKKTDDILERARQEGATGATVINHARGEGFNKKKTFFGLQLDSQCDVILLIVEEHLSRNVLEGIAETGEFESKKGQGIAVQIDVEDVIGVVREIQVINEMIEGENDGE